MSDPPKHPMQPIVLDPRGEPRFHANKAVQWMVERAGETGFFNLNDLYVNDRFSEDDLAQVWQLIGYTVSNYAELDFVSDELVDKAEAAAKDLERQVRLAAPKEAPMTQSEKKSMHVLVMDGPSEYFFYGGCWLKRWGPGPYVIVPSLRTDEGGSVEIETITHASMKGLLRLVRLLKATLLIVDSEGPIEVRLLYEPVTSEAWAELHNDLAHFLTEYLGVPVMVTLAVAP